ncbi:MAG: prepilin-type N-terminal cleavage/methylation domain-containing protein [Verrucomicrobia bacterium]|nr:prepilin-type N-terminal cleavage/methylation domain-containing protein [Verrucomicrobiota bacterium]
MRTRQIYLASRGMPKGVAAFTLAELMVAFSIFMLLIMALLSVQIGGLRMFGLTRAKLGANSDARHVLGPLLLDVRAAKILQVGNMSNGAFAPLAMGTLQAGSAVQVNLTTNTNSFICYYLDSPTSELRRVTNGGAPETVAQYLTNSVLFTAEDYNGRVITTNQNNRVIGVTLQFYQVQYPITQIGTPGAYFDFYQLRTKVTRRAFE